MKTITLRSLTATIDEVAAGKRSYDDLRSYVFSRYESEDDMVVEPAVDDVLAVLGPYVEHEEAFGDPNRQLRLQRLAELLQHPTDDLRSLTLFAIEYDELQNLLIKRNSEIIPEKVFQAQLRMLSPAEFDIDRVLVWGKRHQGHPNPLASKLG